MSLHPLIKNQKIRIDNHGRGQVVVWGNGLHIHKTFVDGRRGGVQILVPFDKDGKVEIRPKGTPDHVFNSVRKEIADALSNWKKREEFVKDIVDAINGFSAGKATEEEARKVGSRIAKYFGLNSEIVEEIVHKYKGLLVLYVSFHQDPIDFTYFSISQKDGNVTIAPSSRRKTINIKSR